MTATEVIILMMGLEMQKVHDALDNLASLAGDLGYENSKKDLRAAQDWLESAAVGLLAHSEGKDE
jgi:hypothetical protein|nr:MAG TPA: hypothetical protein [Caudoviricetes sp.]